MPKGFAIPRLPTQEAFLASSSGTKRKLRPRPPDMTARCRDDEQMLVICPTCKICPFPTNRPTTWARKCAPDGLDPV